MQPVLNVRDVTELEASAAERGLDASELMRRAGTVVALQAMREVGQGSVVVLCGMGNNGGDGWVAADYLAGHGLEVSVVSAAVPALIRGAAARKAAQQAASVGIPVHVAPDYDELAGLLADADVVVDAVFGTGFKGEMGAPYDMWVEAVEDYFEGTLVAVDVPSGVSAATGKVEGPCFQADVTVTMFALKPGLIAGPGKQAAGKIVVASLLGDDEGAEELADSARCYRLGEADYLDALPERDEFADKYGHGRVLVVAGSTRFPGAAVMAAKAAARAGAGYVTLAVPAPVAPVAQAHLLSVPVVGLPAAPDGTFEARACEDLAELAAKADCVLAGPGMGTSFGAGEVVRTLMAGDAPLVLDADALNVAVKICSGSAEEHPDALRREAPLVLTPHARELARLMGREPGSIDCLADLVEASQALAWAVGSANFAVVAKGATSCVSCIDATLVPKAGPSALGTAGTGDVLAGIAAGLLAQQVRELGAQEVGSGDLALLMSAALRIQAVAAQIAVKRLGTRGVMASDLPDLVGVAFDDVQGRAVLAANAYGASESDEDADDEPVMALAPEVAELITADAAERGPEVPGEVHAYEGDLDEPDLDEQEEEGAEEGEPDADAEAGSDGPEGGAAPAQDAPADGREAEPAPDAVVRPAVRVAADSAARPAKGVPAFLAAVEPVVAAAPAAREADGADGPQACAEPEGAEPAAVLHEQAASGDAYGADAPQAQAGGVPAFLAHAGKAIAAATTSLLSSVRQAPEPAAREQVAAPAAAPEPALAEPAAPAVPAFLSQLAQQPAPSPSAAATTIMPALSLDDIAQAQAARAAQPAAPQAAPADNPQTRPTHLSPDVLERQESRARLEEFHERATMRAGDDEVTPVQERPHARRVRRKK